MLINRHYFSQVAQSTVSLTSASYLICNKRENRTFLHIGNHSNHGIFISLGEAPNGEKGIYVPSNSNYEFNSQNGNLYDGVIYGIGKGNQEVTISVVEGFGI